MKVTGFLIREAIRRWELRRDAAAGQFGDSLKRFEGEVKPSPDEVAKTFVDAEVAVSRLQAAQSRYNLNVQVDVLGDKMTLCEAVKRLGGAGRIDKMWRLAVNPERDRYSMHDADIRKDGEIRRAPVMLAKDLMARANKSAAFAGALRAAIAKGNGTEVEDKELNLDSALLTE